MFGRIGTDLCKEIFVLDPQIIVVVEELQHAVPSRLQATQVFRRVYANFVKVRSAGAARLGLRLSWR